MSLIQDALKRKAEEQPPQRLSSPDTVVEEPSQTRRPVVPDNPPRKLIIILAIAVVLILLLVGAGIYFAVNQKPATEPPAFKPQTLVEEAAPIQPATPVVEEEEKPVEKTPQEPVWPELSFSGVAAGDGQRLALINGRMMSAGSQINGVSIVQIGREEVLVEFNGKRRILRAD